MIHDELSCPDARERLSARLDGELGPIPGHAESALLAHLARCGACRGHERALERLARGFEALREPEPLPDLWPRIERRLAGRLEERRIERSRPGAARAALARVAAALLGFASLGAAALAVERARAARPERHLAELLAPLAAPDSLLAELPEYRLLRAFPHAETESR